MNHTNKFIISIFATLIVLSTFVLLSAYAQGPGSQSSPGNSPSIKLKSRTFTPPAGVDPGLQLGAQGLGDTRVHILVQLAGVPDDQERANLVAAGIQLLAYIPDNAWLASIPANNIGPQTLAATSVRWMGPLLSGDKIAPDIQANGVGRWATQPDGSVALSVSFYDDVPAAEALAVLAQHGGQVILDRGDFHNYVAQFPGPAAVNTLAAEEVVLWVDNGPSPVAVRNDGARQQANVDAVQQQETGLNGTGVVLGEWDGGAIEDTHEDFIGRLTVIEGQGASASDRSHATHVAGTMAGSGQRSQAAGGTPFQWRGVATAATIISYDFQGNTVTEHEPAINTYNIDLSQNSWGPVVSQNNGNCGLNGAYDVDSQLYDQLVTGFYTKPLLILFAAGNSRDLTVAVGDGCRPNGVGRDEYYDNIAGASNGKNTIAVGATNSNDDSMTDFSDWGPMDDGRVKPEVVAPGCEVGGNEIFSADLGNTYGSKCGTSMATPLVSGISALIIQQYRTSYAVTNPRPASVKAVLIHTAKDLDDASTFYNPGPDYASGYGRVDAQAAINVVKAKQVQESQITNGITQTYALTVTAGITSLKVTLVWDDVAGTPLASPTLVNNLDLELVASDGTTIFSPWVLNPATPSADATTGVDNINNVEQVSVSNPTAGVWTVRVKGTNVPSGPQRYSLVAPVTAITPPTINIYLPTILKQ